MEGGRQDRDDAADASERRSHAGRSEDAGVPLRPPGAGGRSGQRGPDRAVDGGSERAASAAHAARDPEFPGGGDGSRVVDQAGGRAADLPYHGPAKRRHLGPPQQHFWQAVFGLLAGFVGWVRLAIRLAIRTSARTPTWQPERPLYGCKVDSEHVPQYTSPAVWQ